jgi:regulator of sirC expression with transglutaminase-like and TPR domain
VKVRQIAGRYSYLMKLLVYFIIAVSILMAPQARANAQPAIGPSSIVRDILSVPDDQLDYARAKLAVDRIVDPSLNADAILAEIERLARAADALAGASAPPAERLAALRRVIYESGEWNGGRPFSYDHADPLGQNVRNKLISTYLATRRGNCVSMPVLVLLVGERMGLNLALSTAPLHIFLRYTDEGGREINREATSGALPARTLWYRQNLPMSDRAIASGLYMRTLSRREAIAHMASTDVDFLMGEGRYQEAIEVAQVILQHAPRDGYTLVKLGSAYGELLRIEFLERFAAPALIPTDLRPRFALLAQRNRRAFEAAEALGWEAADQ